MSMKSPKADLTWITSSKFSLPTLSSRWAASHLGSHAQPTLICVMPAFLIHRTEELPNSSLGSQALISDDSARFSRAKPFQTGWVLGGGDISFLAKQCRRRYLLIYSYSNPTVEERMNFETYQQRAAETDHMSPRGLKGQSFSVFGLNGQVGALTDCFKKKLRDKGAYLAFEKDVSTEIGNVLWYLSSIATRMGLNLSKIALENLDWNSSRWPSLDGSGAARVTKDNFDESYPIAQRFPRVFAARFKEVRKSPKSFLPIVEVFVFDKQFGDSIDSNVKEDDGYRFHDAMHFAHVAVLGWSPVVRGLMGRKRKANKEVDKLQDGACSASVENAGLGIELTH